MVNSSSSSSFAQVKLPEPLASCLFYPSTLLTLLNPAGPLVLKPWHWLASSTGSSRTTTGCHLNPKFPKP
jgi:hypothetical protein